MNAHSISTSPSLIQRVKKHEHDAWDRFVDIYTPLIHRWIRPVVAQQADAADIVQDVLQAIATSVDRFDPSKGSSFRGWLWGITQNKLARYRHKRANNPGGVGGSTVQTLIAEIPDAPPTDLREELAIIARRAVDLIRTDFAASTFEAFWRVTVENQQPKQVAEDMGMSVSAVYKAKSRVLAQLRRELELPLDL